MSSFDRKSRDLSSRTRRNVRTVSKESRTIGISCKTCLSFARCVESKQRLNKDIFVLAFVNLDAIPISPAYKMPHMNHANHISLRISKDSGQNELFNSTVPVSWSCHRLGRDPCRK